MSAPKKSTAKAPAEGRKKSLLTQAGDRAKWETERALLLKTLKAKGWNLTHAAYLLLEMGAHTQSVHDFASVTFKKR